MTEDQSTNPVPNITSLSRNNRILLYCIFSLILLLGCALRIARVEKIPNLGFDETYYIKYTNWHATHNLDEMADYCKLFYNVQLESSVGLPSPFRVLYPYLGMLVHKCSGFTYAFSLVVVSAMCSILVFLLSSIMCLRMFGTAWACAIAALIAVSFNQLHQSQRILIDSVMCLFCVIALWSVWEMGNGKPRFRICFLIAYILSMFCMVFIKENAFFIYVGIASLIMLGYRLRVIKQPIPYLLPITVATGACALTALCMLAGGFERFFDIYIAVVEKSLVTPYVIVNGDGPWYRYIVDSMLAQPIITILAIAGIMHLPFSNHSIRFLSVFMLVTFALMCQVKYGQFFRYSIIWDLPLRALAAFQLWNWIVKFNFKYTKSITVACLALICIHEYLCYWQVCVKNQAYALETSELINNLKLFKYKN
jgi:hypothetical protein